MQIGFRLKCANMKIDERTRRASFFNDFLVVLDLSVSDLTAGEKVVNFPIQ